MDELSQGLRISANLYACMLSDVSLRAPLEACGLLGGVGDLCLAVIPVTNALQSRVRFRMQPVEQLRAFLLLEGHGLSLLGIYHSHPAGPEGMSALDLAEAYYPEAAHLIWSPSGAGWECRCYRLLDGRALPVPLRVFQ